MTKLTLSNKFAQVKAQSLALDREHIIGIAYKCSAFAFSIVSIFSANLKG